MADDHGLTVRVVDAISIGTLLGSLFHELPDIAAMFTILWTSIRIYETRTIQNLLKKHPK